MREFRKALVFGRGGGGVEKVVAVLERVFAHEMLREIYEQPEAIRRTLALYVPQTGEGTELDR
jgi:glucosamine 6-phosphate synthetase-like amidotransferase/phosphosugar isomerase protein